MAEAPNGHLLVANSDVINSNTRLPSEIVEFTKQGQFIDELSVDPAQGGSFGLAVNVIGQQSFFAAVDDNTATLSLWRMPSLGRPVAQYQTLLRFQAGGGLGGGVESTFCFTRVTFTTL